MPPGHVVRAAPPRREPENRFGVLRCVPRLPSYSGEPARQLTARSTDSRWLIHFVWTPRLNSSTHATRPHETSSTRSKDASRGRTCPHSAEASRGRVSRRRALRRRECRGHRRIPVECRRLLSPLPGPRRWLPGRLPRMARVRSRGDTSRPSPNVARLLLRASSSSPRRPDPRRQDCSFGTRLSHKSGAPDFVCGPRIVAPLAPRSNPSRRYSRGAQSVSCEVDFDGPLHVLVDRHNAVRLCDSLEREQKPGGRRAAAARSLPESFRLKACRPRCRCCRLSREGLCSTSLLPLNVMNEGGAVRGRGVG